MNATSLEELRAGQAPQATPTVSPVAHEAVDSGDDKMEQIRQLLLGDRLTAAREQLVALETRQKEFETTVLHRLDLLSQRLDALSRDILADRRTAFDELSRAVHEFGNRVRGL